jgi:hypothetical protein
MADLVHGALIEADSGHTALTECGVITSCLVPSPRTPSLTPDPVCDALTISDHAHFAHGILFFPGSP